MRVGLIGRGALGDVVASALAGHSIPGVELAGVLRRSVRAAGDVESIDELLAPGCDVVVEAAGHEAVRDFALPVLEAGVDLVVLSAGSLADPSLEARLRSAGPGRLSISTGAIGGLDIARALAESGSLESVVMKSTAVPAAFADGELEGLPAAGGPRLVMAGSAREVSLAFPRLTNVAATAALATIGLDALAAELWVDPSGAAKRHEMSLVASHSTVHVEVVNALSDGNPRTSAVTPYSVLRLLRDRVEPFTVGV